MSTQPPAGTNDRSYPGVTQVADSATQIALRLLHDLRALLEERTRPAEGTLDPDTRPKLTPLRVGFLFHSTDFDRVFRWTGVEWTDAPGQPARGGISWFPLDTPPGPGWARCSGQQIVSTQADATVRSFPAPTIDAVNGCFPWIRL